MAILLFTILAFRKAINIRYNTHKCRSWKIIALVECFQQHAKEKEQKEKSTFIGADKHAFSWTDRQTDRHIGSEKWS